MQTLSEVRGARRLRLSDGTSVAAARAGDVDAALRELTEATLGPAGGVTLVAVGGYGRREMSPHSDVDLLCLVGGSGKDVTPATLRGLLYPLWDAGFQVGHAVRTSAEAVEHARKDLDAATSLLSARLVAGDEAAFDELLDRRTRWLAKSARSLVRAIVASTEARHAARDRAGWSLAPDLKDDAGGLRDLHALEWLEAATGETFDDLAEERCVLLAAREGLHAQSKRKLDTLRIDLQPAVAEALGFEGDDRADALMERVHSSARSVEHRTRRVLEEVSGRGPRRSGSAAEVAPGVRLQDGALTALGSDPASCMAVLAAHAELGKPLSPHSLDLLEAAFDGDPVVRWDGGLRASFVRLLGGRAASSALELLDHAGAWRVLLPEWSGIRGRAQHDPYHRYTVDGHSFVAVDCVHRALATDEVARGATEAAGSLDALLLATLLHDVGKGSGEDHSVAGERLARSAATRIGFDHATVEEIAALVRWHLLLVDTATRRDLDDGAVIEDVAASIETPRLLRLLYVLSVADGLATGPEGWTAWKSSLVRDLFRKALVALETGELPARSDVSTRAREVIAFEPALAGSAEEVLSTLPPSYLDSATVAEIADDIRLLLHRPQHGQVVSRVEPGTEEGTDVLTVCVADRPGALARTAGVLTMNLVTVLSARAFSTSSGLALQRFTVKPAEAARMGAVAAGLEAAFAGRVALEARLTRKALDYRPAAPVSVEVRIVDDASVHSTVVEVRGPDALGLLYAITAGLGDLDLDIHVAKIDTLGARVVDTFYVRDSRGKKLEPEQAGEIERAVAHRVEALFR